MAEFNNAIYVDDIYHTCINAYTSQREDDMIINLHSSDTVTLGEFVNMIASKTGKHATIEEDESMPASFTIANKTSGGLLITRTLEGIVDAYFRSVMVS